MFLECSIHSETNLFLKLHQRNYACGHISFIKTLMFYLLFKEKSVLEEIDVIVNSLLDILLRTILEITSRPQPSGSAMRLQFQDVTVSFLQ